MGRNSFAYGMILLCMAAFAVIVAKGVTTAQPGDENVYYYMGKLVSEGKVPYRDFFYAHPPLHIYFLAFFYKMFGFNIAILKSVPLILTFISAFFVFEIAKKKSGNAAAIASFLLFLFSYSIMFNSVFSFGTELAVVFLAAGAYSLWNKDNHVLSGLFFGLAGTTRLLSLLPISIIIATVFLSNKRNFMKLSSAFFAVFLFVNGLFFAVSGDGYLGQVYRFHLLKSFSGAENLNEYIDIVKLNWIMFLSAALFVFVKEKKKMGVFASVSAVYLVFLTLLKKIFGFYFLIAFPFLAIIGGCSLIGIINSLIQSKRWRICILLAFLSVFMWNLAADTYFLNKIGFAGFERGKDLADFVASNSDKGTMLFGDDSVVPLIALLTGKEIAFDIADTNNQVFTTGLVSLKNVLNKLEGKDVVFIIRSTQGISQFSEVRVFLSKNCEFLSRFHDKTEGSYLVYKCSPT